MERAPPLPQQHQNRGNGLSNSTGGGESSHSLWGSLPMLVRASSKESVEYILQALWRTRKTGLDSADRTILCDMLHLDSDSDLDPLLVCLRMLIRRCVHEDTRREDIQKLFPEVVSPELQRLLTLLLQKFRREWREDAHRDRVSVPRLKALTWNMADQGAEAGDRVAVLNLKLQGEEHSLLRDKEVEFQLTKDTLETMLTSMYSIRDQFSSGVETPSVHPQSQETA